MIISNKDKDNIIKFPIEVEKEKNNIIPFPKNKIVNSPQNKTLQNLKRWSKIKEAEDITEYIFDDMHEKFENANLEYKQEDIIFLADTIRSAVYRCMGMNHQLQQFIDTCVREIKVTTIQEMEKEINKQTAKKKVLSKKKKEPKKMEKLREAPSNTVTLKEPVLPPSQRKKPKPTLSGKVIPKKVTRKVVVSDTPILPPRLRNKTPPSKKK